MTDALLSLAPEEFPPLIREIPDAPKRLFVRGALPPLDHAWLAVVGSRAATSYGRHCCAHFIQGLAGYPVTIVSGLAFGIDACAHKAALDAGLPTVAVPGSGLDWDVLYPRANLQLARAILAADGALLSEFEPDERAAPYTFPKRNRIMAGLSHATLVIEAKEKSGSLITARLATEYNRELLVVPGSVFSAESRGTHQFLKLGATPVTESEDIVRALGLDARGAKAPRASLSEDEKHVLKLLTSPMPKDELLRALGIATADAQVLLSTMELKGLIEEQLGTVRTTG